MLQQATIHFLTELAKNNNKEWFDANRDKYATAKEDFEGFVTGIIKGLATTDPDFTGLLAKDCIFRIFRDVRFGKDKTPYKPNFGAAFSKTGRKGSGAGYYLHIEPGGKCFAGGGMWMPEPAALKKIRQEIDYNFKEFDTIVNDKKFKKLFPEIEGEKLKKLPAGYTEDNPAIEYLKLKSFVAGHKGISDNDLTSKNLAKDIVGIFNTMKPFIDFLNKGVE
jgi:uncharacterized protein (TIGR02453 family)